VFVATGSVAEEDTTNPETLSMRINLEAY